MTLDQAPPSSDVAAVAGAPAPDAATHALQQVEDLLQRRLRGLAASWHRGSAHDDPVLGGHDLPELLRRLVLGGGKRVRPLLVHCGWACVPGRDSGPGSAQQEQVVVLGAALELLHAFGLAQDDVMDRSETRRGQPAVHVRASRLHRGAGGHDDPDRYGEGIAVLVGDLAHTEAADLVADLPAPLRARWRDLSRELVRGQARDLSQAALPGADARLERAWNVARAKTGAYSVQRPLELGAAVAGADVSVLGRVSRAGHLLGEAFALRDDLLGVWGDPAVTGKPVGDDLRDGKSTVLLALAERRFGPVERALVDRVRRHEHDDADVRRLTEALERHGVRDDVEGMIALRRRRAGALLRGPGLDPEGVAGLLRVADRLVQRDC